MRDSSPRYLIAALACVLLAVFVITPSGAGPGALPRKMAFDGELHNSLYHIDEAKWKWTQERHKSEHDVPTMADLAPYLGDWTNRIERLNAAGVEYKITPISESEPQSDVATLTHSVRFQKGFCRFYGAGTSVSLHGGWTPPPFHLNSWTEAFYQNNRGLLFIALFALALGNLLVFAVKWIQHFKQTNSIVHEPQNV